MYHEPLSSLLFLVVFCSYSILSHAVSLNQFQFNFNSNLPNQFSQFAAHDSPGMGSLLKEMLML